MDEFLGLYASLILVGLIIAAFITGIMFLVPIAIIAVVCILIYSNVSPNSKKNQDKAQIEQTQQLYQQALAISPLTRDEFSDFIEDHTNNQKILHVALELYRMEGFEPPDPPPPIITGIEGGRYRDKLHNFINISQQPQNAERFKSAVLNTLLPFDQSDTPRAMFKAHQNLSNDEIDELVKSFFGDHDMFKPLRNILDRNYNEQNAVPPSDYKGKNCAWDYLKDTPLLMMEYRHVNVDWRNREAHTLILGGSGSGKTTLFKQMIAKLLKEDCCVVVMDSQTQFIEELAHIKLGEDELTWISPEHALALNPFDIFDEDLKDESVINNKISLLEFVVEHLIEAPMTPRQKNLFYYCTQLLLTIPGGNVGTFMDILNDPFEFADYIDELDKSAQRFFNQELNSEGGRGKKGSSYNGTREELTYRLEGLIKQPTFRRIFQSEENTFDFYSEMQKRKLILLDTSHALLADDSPTLGRFYTAQALQACFQRVKNKETDRPVIFFIDEAHEYFDEKLEKMLLQARKANIGMVLAIQDFSKASKAGIADTLLGSTSTQIVSKVIVSDARKLAPRMKTTHEFLTNLGEHEFAFYSGQKTVTVRADEDPLIDYDKRGNLEQLRKDMEFHYGPEKPETPPEKSAMDDNEGQDIKPGDTL